MKWGLLFFIILFQVAIVSAQIANITVNEGELVVLKPIANDPDGDNIYYSFSKPLDEKGQWQTDYNDAGVNEIKVNASDGMLIDKEEVLLVVNDIDREPYFNPPLDDITAFEGEEISFNINATDPDNDSINYFSFDMPEDASLNESKFYWKPNYDTVRKNWFERILSDYFNYVPKRTFDVTFIIKSNGKESRQGVDITVRNKNRPPVMKKIGNITIREGQELVFNPRATDPDGDDVRYWYSGFSDSRKKYIDYDKAGVYNVFVHATDGKNYSTQNVTVIVENKNRAPVIESGNEFVVDENNTLKFDASAYDPDGDIITFLTIENMPEGSTFFNNTFKWTPDFSTVENDKKDFVITLFAGDYNLSSKKNVTITVYNDNRAPVIYNVTPKKIIKTYEGQIVNFNASAYDPDNESINYIWKFGTFETYTDGNTHSRIFTIPGRKPVELIVSDGEKESTYRWIVDVFEKPEEITAKPEGQVFKKYTIKG
jgi:hypothetical protein